MKKGGRGGEKELERKRGRSPVEETGRRKEAKKGGIAGSTERQILELWDPPLFFLSSPLTSFSHSSFSPLHSLLSLLSLLSLSCLSPLHLLLSRPFPIYFFSCAVEHTHEQQKTQEEREKKKRERRKRRKPIIVSLPSFRSLTLEQNGREEENCPRSSVQTIFSFHSSFHSSSTLSSFSHPESEKEGERERESPPLTIHLFKPHFFKLQALAFQ